MYKPLEYSSLHNLVEDYEQAYTNCGHDLVKVNSAFREGGKIDRQTFEFYNGKIELKTFRKRLYFVCCLSENKVWKFRYFFSFLTPSL